MYICPTCGSEFKMENDVVKHFLSCWKQKHPRMDSKAAPHTEIITRKDNADVLNFFNSFK